MWRSDERAMELKTAVGYQKSHKVSARARLAIRTSITDRSGELLDLGCRRRRDAGSTRHGGCNRGGRAGVSKARGLARFFDLFLEVSVLVS